MNEQDIVKLVERYLDKHQPSEYRLSVNAQATHCDGDWWYVGVRPDRQVRRQYDYYDVLAQVEEEIENDEAGVNVLLVPMAAEVAK